MHTAGARLLQAGTVSRLDAVTGNGGLSMMAFRSQAAFPRKGATTNPWPPLEAGTIGTNRRPGAIQ